MKIQEIKLRNYKSIADSGKLKLNENINIFAGRNNTGKTALIEAIYNLVNGNLTDVNLVDIEDSSHFVMKISIDEEELRDLNSNVQLDFIIVSVESLILDMTYNFKESKTSINSITGIINGTTKLLYSNYSRWKGESREYISYAYYSPVEGETSISFRPQVINNLISLLKKKIVFISGTRNFPKIETAKLQESISSDGTNLNSFLFTLHNNDEMNFDKIRNTFKQIFTDVTSVTTPVNADNLTNISLYFDGSREQIPLYNCGSGFTHVLLLLCVLYTKENSVVLFDEPHVFLHPSAEKAIYDLINDTDYHQYFLTTHSPILINYPFDKQVFHVKKENGFSNYSGLNAMQELLSEIGVNNSDFALSDKVLFVEGETEEAIIPIILSHFGMKQIGYNYRILKMNGTGNEFSKKSAMTRHKEKLDLILRGISTSPIPYKILIDSDEKSDAKIKEIEEKYGDNVFILERRELENYFLDCYEELSHVININFESDVCNLGEIESFLGELLTRTDDKKLFPRGVVANPVNNVVGSQALESLFEKYGLSYNKIIHGVQITNLVLHSNPEKLSFLKEKLENFIKPK
ncbi:ATP-dependent nuclease [Peribacillus frigoritolerans]|uniref:ATP-dependent nuclease n=1 Tax=Peribacillus frigoritolerans TaxID=450367 RepID=UPI0024C10DF9|nr:AAA family ATPase [Peribacillus frigoritolerans]WHX62774.1 AAA family ATPase [Peribacillus frigoritolerans]